MLTGVALSGYHFGFGTFSSTRFSGYPATAMIATDLWENDGSGTTPNTRGDHDIVYVSSILGLSFWAYVTNNWTAGGTPFSSTSHLTVGASATPYSLIADTLRKGSSPRAIDLLVGTTGSNNIEVWGRTGSSLPSSALRRIGTADAGRTLALATLDCSAWLGGATNSPQPRWPSSPKN